MNIIHNIPFGVASGSTDMTYSTHAHKESRSYKRLSDGKSVVHHTEAQSIHLWARWIVFYSLCSVFFSQVLDHNQAMAAFTTDRGSKYRLQQNKVTTTGHKGDLELDHSYPVTTFFMTSSQGNGDIPQEENKSGSTRKKPKSKKRKWGSSIQGQTKNNHTSTLDHPHSKNDRKMNKKQSFGKEAKQNKQQSPATSTATTTTTTSAVRRENKTNQPNHTTKHPSTLDPSQITHLQKRITQLEAIVATQSVELCRLREQWKELRDVASTFAQVVDLLRQAGLSPTSNTAINPTTDGSNQTSKEPSKQIQPTDETRNKTLIDNTVSQEKPDKKIQDDWEIFGRAPSSVMDAADAAGASILAALLGGKQRMLVDVRDAELSRDPDILVQFIELAILPVAAGLEGLSSMRNRVKLVFPTVSQLLQYRKMMALAAPEVVALSTLGFDPVEKRDNLVVIIAPPPDDDEGLAKMNALLEEMRPPVVVLNHHMVPIVGPASQFEQVYLLRLFTVQYMMGGNPPLDDLTISDDSLKSGEKTKPMIDQEGKEKHQEDEDNAALEAAMKHAHELGTHQGITRAMVIRAYPKPWHIFVDTSPDTDADFEVAATFDECPSQDDINYAIVECLEGSEREDELVAQQMQQALEAGQLNKVSEMFGIPGVTIDTNASMFGIDQLLDNTDNLGSKDDGLFYDDWDLWKDTDTV